MWHAATHLQPVNWQNCRAAKISAEGSRRADNLESRVPKAALEREGRVNPESPYHSQANLLIRGLPHPTDRFPFVVGWSLPPRHLGTRTDPQVDPRRIDIRRSVPVTSQFDHGVVTRRERPGRDGRILLRSAIPVPSIQSDLKGYFAVGVRSPNAFRSSLVSALAMTGPRGPSGLSFVRVFPPAWVP